MYAPHLHHMFIQYWYVRLETIGGTVIHMREIGNRFDTLGLIDDWYNMSLMIILSDHDVESRQYESNS